MASNDDDDILSEIWHIKCGHLAFIYFGSCRRRVVPEQAMKLDGSNFSPFAPPTCGHCGQTLSMNETEIREYIEKDGEMYYVKKYNYAQDIYPGPVDSNPVYMDDSVVYDDYRNIEMKLIDSIYPDKNGLKKFIDEVVRLNPNFYKGLIDVIPDAKRIPDKTDKAYLKPPIKKTKW